MTCFCAKESDNTDYLTGSAVKRLHLFIRLRLAYSLIVLFSLMYLNVAEPYLPNKRAGHSTIVINDQLYVWGGEQPGLPIVHSTQLKREFTSYVDVFHRKVEV